jgi:hypothetical protein
MAIRPFLKNLFMSEVPKSTIEIKVARFIAQYGGEQLIEWLDEFDYMGGPVKFRQFKKIEKLSCEAFGITLADMHILTNTECINAKRVIAFIAFNRINLAQHVICKLLGNVSLRSIGYYIKDAEHWISNPKANKSFTEAYYRVFEKFNIE